MPPTPKWPARTVFPQVWDENALDYTPQTIGTATGPASAVSVTNFPATQPVSGPLTDTQLRATPVPVSATIDTTGLATDTAQTAGNATLTQIAGYLDTVEAKLQSVIDNTDGLEGFTDGVETLLTAIRDYVDTVETALTTLNAKDFATQTTLALIKAKTDNLDAQLSTLATQATLALIKAKTDNLDAALSTLATAAAQTTGNGSLASIKTNTDSFVVAGAGGYVRQDSTATIAKESGGNLATIATNSALAATAAKQDTGNTSLATIAGKDFATSAKQDTANTAMSTLVAQTDAVEGSLSSIDGKLTTGIVISDMPPVSASSSADVLDIDDDAGYTDGETGKNLTQTFDGRLRTAIAALVSERPESYVDGDIKSLSLNSEGRLRVATYPASTYLDFFPSVVMTAGYGDVDAVFPMPSDHPWSL